MKTKLFILVLMFSVSSYGEYKFETVLSNLDDAWSFEFLNEDTVIYTEMPGKLKIASLDNSFVFSVFG